MKKKSGKEVNNMIIQIISYFFPSVIAVWITETLFKEEFKLKKFTYFFSLYTIIINLIMLCALVLFTETQTDYFSLEQQFGHTFTIKYLSIALSLAIILSYISKIIKNNINIKFDIQDNNEKKKQNKK